jgi:hypothetical protein
MGNLSNYARNKLLDHTLKLASYSRPENLYLALLDAEPDADDTPLTISEVSGGNYSRKLINSWDTASGRVTANSTGIVFPEVSVSLGVVSHFAILDTLTALAGNMIAFGAVSPNRSLEQGVSPSILKGDLDVSFNAGGVSDYLANKLLDHVFKGTLFSQPSTITAAYSANSILDSSTGSSITEPGNGYARESVNGFGAASSGQSKNSNPVTFPTATGSQGNIATFSLLDALTYGNILFHGTLNTIRAIGEGDTPRFYANALTASLS